MFHNQEKLIDINLQYIYDNQKGIGCFYTDFTDENGRDLSIAAKKLAQSMEDNELIRLNNYNCTTTDFGDEVISKGGWINYSKLKDEEDTRFKSLEDEIKELTKDNLAYQKKTRGIDKQVKLSTIFNNYWGLILSLFTFIIGNYLGDSFNIIKSIIDLFNN